MCPQQLELLPIPPKYSHITLVRKDSSLVKHRSVFKTALLVYKFLQSGCCKYLEPFLKPIYSVYKTCRSQSDGVLKVVVSTWNLSLNPYIVCTKLVEVNLMVFCLRSHTLHQYIRIKSILASALHMMAKNLEWSA